MTRILKGVIKYNRNILLTVIVLYVIPLIRLINTNWIKLNEILVIQATVPLFIFFVLPLINKKEHEKFLLLIKSIPIKKVSIINLINIYFIIYLFFAQLTPMLINFTTIQAKEGKDLIYYSLFCFILCAITIYLIMPKIWYTSKETKLFKQGLLVYIYTLICVVAAIYKEMTNNVFTLFTIVIFLLGARLYYRKKLLIF